MIDMVDMVGGDRFKMMHSSMIDQSFHCPRFSLVVIDVDVVHRSPLWSNAY